MRTTFIIFFIFLFSANSLKSQTSFDSGEGCLNIVDFNLGQRIGEYGDKGFSLNYLHEKLVNEQFSIGAGIGYNHHSKYNFSSVPVFLSTHYFLIDRRFSPFVNLRVGVYGMFKEKNVGRDEKYSIAKKSQDFNLYVSPSAGFKMHLTPIIGVVASVSDDGYLVKAFDTSKNDYKSKLIHSLGINIGICFQIRGW